MKREQETMTLTDDETAYSEADEKADQEQMEEAIVPPINEDEHLELIKKAAKCRMLLKMVEQPGWNMIFAPWLQAKRQELITGMLNAREHIDFLTAQQAINTIDIIFKSIETDIESGLIAAKRVEERPIAQ